MLFFFQAEDGIRYLVRSRGLGDVYKRQIHVIMLSGQEYISNAVSTLKYGAFDYVEKNQDSFGRLLSMIDRLTIVDKEIEAVNTKGKKTLRHRLGLPASFVVAVTSLFSSGS